MLSTNDGAAPPVGAAVFAAAFSETGLGSAVLAVGAETAAKAFIANPLLKTAFCRPYPPV
jgi:hypothetical protein